MSELVAFVHLGFRHITDVAALDHILFLLALAVTGALRLPTPLIEFLIPVTILVTGLENILVRRRDRAPLRGGYRPVFAGVFGLVHGAGFANYLQSLFVGSIVVPLLGFNAGIELGQLVVLGLAALALTGLDRAIALLRAPEATPSVLRLRVVAVSAVVVAVAAEMAASRTPW